MRRRAVGVALVVAAALAACGGDDKPADTPYIRAVGKVVKQGSAHLPWTDALARCVAAAYVEGIGEAELRAEGLTERAINEGTSFDALGIRVVPAKAAEIGDRIARCDGVRDLFTASLQVSSGLSDDARRCITEQLDDDIVSEFFAAGLRGEATSGAGQKDFLDAVARLYDACPEATSTSGLG